MTTAPAMTHYTADDLLAMEDGDRYELDDGELVDTTMGLTSGETASEVNARLWFHVREHKLGRVLDSSIGYQLFPRTRPNRIPRPDISFLSNDRLRRAEREGWVRIAPDLAVEVVSEHDNARYLQRKVTEYLEAGVRMVWVVYPDTRQVLVHMAGSVRPLGEDDILDGGDVVPGFAVRVGDLIPEPIGTEAEQPAE